MLPGVGVPLSPAVMSGNATWASPVKSESRMMLTQPCSSRRGYLRPTMVMFDYSRGECGGNRWRSCDPMGRRWSVLFGHSFPPGRSFTEVGRRRRAESCLREMYSRSSGHSSTPGPLGCPYWAYIVASIWYWPRKSEAYDPLLRERYVRNARGRSGRPDA